MTRAVVCIEASFGLGEALVSGLVNADVYQVRDGEDGEVAAKAVAAKKLAIQACPAGGTREQAIEPARQEQPALTDAQIAGLAQLGRRIEAHFGQPQDIEWCLVDDGFQIVQSRPITTLFPVPPSSDQGNHVYVSVGHQQMMTDPMKPLGLSVWQLTTPRPMAEAGGRLFVDVTQILGSPTGRAGLLKAMRGSDPLMGDALQTILDRGDLIPAVPTHPTLPDEPLGGPLADSEPVPIETDPAIATELVERGQASLAALQRDIAALSGPELLDFILADFQELRRSLFDPQGLRVIMAAMLGSGRLNEQLQEWLGEKNAADTLTQSVPHNVTSEMGLALLDVADAIRPHPDVVAFLQHVEEDNLLDEDFLDELPALAGGREARDAIAAYLAIKGLVTEVGGLMTHGAVIAREYGLPAVVGVEHATRLIGDGQRIRVHGTDGYIEILD
jgi:rifampicin phosphotransferase